MRFFNNAGPVDCNKNYCLDPVQRIDLPELEELIAQERYFVLHAPRQTGQAFTDAALELVWELTRASPGWSTPWAIGCVSATRPCASATASSTSNRSCRPPRC